MFVQKFHTFEQFFIFLLSCIVEVSTFKPISY